MSYRPIVTVQLKNENSFLDDCWTNKNDKIQKRERWTGYEMMISYKEPHTYVYIILYFKVLNCAILSERRVNGQNKGIELMRECC